MTLFARFWQWCRDKYGRIVTAVGGFLMTANVLDLGIVKQPIADLVGDRWATKIVAGAALLCFVLSWVRHQQVANKVSKAPLPPPDPRTVVKLILILCAIAIAVIAPRAYATEVPVEKDAPTVEGHPLTSVVVTQCNLIVAVYMTMPDGRLLRFDKAAAVPSDQLMTMAYSATRSERVEVSCNDVGAAGFEKHEPV